MLKLNVENRVQLNEDFMPKPTDIVIMSSGAVNIVATVGRHEDGTSIHKLITLKGANRWSDEDNTLEAIRDLILKYELEVYRDSELNLILGQRVK